MFKKTFGVFLICCLFFFNITTAFADWKSDLLIVQVNLGNDAAVKSLIQAGADVNVKDPKEGITPLMIASYKGNVRCIQMLLEAGANVNALTKSRITALMAAAEGGHLEGLYCTHCCGGSARRAR